jgi:hypothetical protein
MEYYDGNIEPKTTKQKITRILILVISICIFFFVFKYQEAKNWKAERIEMVESMRDALERQEYSTALAVYQRNNKAQQDPELTSLHQKATEEHEIQEEAKRVEAIAKLEEHLRNTTGEDRKENLFLLAMLDPENEEFKEEISAAKEEVQQQRLRQIKEDRERQEEARLAAKRKERIESQFSAWNGAHVQFERIIKKAMNDPSSYKHVETRYFDQGDSIRVVTSFRGKNAFGGVVKNTMVAEFTLSGRLLRVIE